MELHLSCGEQLVNVLMSVPYQQEAQVDLLEDVQADEQGEESKHEDVLVLSSTVISL